MGHTYHRQLVFTIKDRCRQMSYGMEAERLHPRPFTQPLHEVLTVGKGLAQVLLTKRGVVEVHDLHIWAMSTTETALTAHLVYAELPHDCALVQQASQHLYDRFGIDHVTLQVEYPEAPGGCAGRERASCQTAGQG